MIVTLYHYGDVIDTWEINLSREPVTRGPLPEETETITDYRYDRDYGPFGGRGDESFARKWCARDKKFYVGHTTRLAKDGFRISWSYGADDWDRERMDLGYVRSMSGWNWTAMDTVTCN